ncbi:MAG: hypothetical protein ACLU77_11960 [Waltera sp.]
MTKHELHRKDRIISPLIEQGQSPYQIITNHPELELSVRSVYTYLDMGILTARNIDLKRKVKFKPRKIHKTQISDRRVFQGRTYTDFQQLGLVFLCGNGYRAFPPPDRQKHCLLSFYKGKAVSCFPDEP